MTKRWKINDYKRLEMKNFTTQKRQEIVETSKNTGCNQSDLD